jgi:2-polyprenyl-6-methoxyphenol hydroxylase-like FAD-dependent oxidoreductase
MRFAVAGGGVAGLASALLLARAGHSVVVVERDPVEPSDSSQGAFEAPRKGIPHFQQPHAFLPRGRRELRESAPDVLDALREAGAQEQDVAEKLHGPREPGDEDLVYLWVRRPVIEWVLRRAAAAEANVTLRSGETVAGVTGGGLALQGGEVIAADLVVDALGRYRTPAGWPRATGEPSSCGAIYYCRYFEGELPTGPWLLNPSGNLGYMGFNTFRGDNGTFAVIFLVPEHDRGLRALKDDAAWMAAASAIRPLDEIVADARPLTGVMPMGGLANALRAGDRVHPRVVPVGDALCHTDPSMAYGLSFALSHAVALAQAAAEEDAVEAYLQAVRPEAAERYRLAVDIDAARVQMSKGEPLQIGRRDGCYPLFAFAGAVATAPHDDHILRRTIGRIGLLDRTSVFDTDSELHDRIERAFAQLRPPPPPGPPRDELLARIGV